MILSASAFLPLCFLNCGPRIDIHLADNKMAPPKLLDGLVALVTGGGSGTQFIQEYCCESLTDLYTGYGEGIATLFAEGAKVVILDISEGGARYVKIYQHVTGFNFH